MKYVHKKREKVLALYQNPDVSQKPTKYILDLRSSDPREEKKPGNAFKNAESARLKPHGVSDKTGNPGC